MSQPQDSDISDIFDLELQLQERINELEWKSKSLEDSQRELGQLRQELLNKDLELESKRRSLGELHMQLSTANQVIEWLEKEKSRCASERVQLQVSCDAALKERESLLEQAHAARLENMSLRAAGQRQAEALATSEAARSALETSLAELQERAGQVHGSLQSNVAKLEKEHQLLLKSVESTIQLNKRLQTVGLCTHAIYTKKNDEIKQLQKELASKEPSAAKPAQIFHNSVMETKRKKKFDTKALLEQVHMDIEKAEEADADIEAMLAEFED